MLKHALYRSIDELLVANRDISSKWALKREPQRVGRNDRAPEIVDVPDVADLRKVWVARHVASR